MRGASALRTRWRYPDRPDLGGNDNRPALAGFEDTPELACLVHALPPDLLQAAAARSRTLGVGADQVLIQWGGIDEASYLRHLARHLRLGIESFSDIAPDDTPLTPEQLHQAARSGLLPVRHDGALVWVLAPQHLGARRVSQFVVRHPDLSGRIRLTTRRRLQDRLQRHGGGALTREAIHGMLARRSPLTAAPRSTAPAHMQAAATAAAVATLIAVAAVTGPLWTSALAIWLLAFIGLRLAASFAPPPRGPDHLRLADHALPVYSIIIALYREAVSVPWLLHAINALDYPKEKLDLILAVEADDRDTQDAIARFGPMPHLRVVVAPAEGPRTKPKALNAALPFARGSFITVFDAEDRPDPDQLRVALDAFRHAGDDLACVQARLSIDNAKASLFSRMFAVEYAGQFDLVLPGLARFGLPLPLGGSSNHFRADALRDAGGWDAFNVTEDADLGLRLARFGYRSATIASSTPEEAPITFGVWLRQRSRWMKGFMQTWRVHMRHPRQLWREAGAGGVIAVNLVIGGQVLSALAFPIFPAALIAYLAGRIAPSWTVAFPDGVLSPLNLATLVAGYAATAIIGLRALARQGEVSRGWILLLTPLYWGCLSLAAWRAVWQLWRDPYRWEKTEHGLGRSETPQMAAPTIVAWPSRRTPRTTA